MQTRKKNMIHSQNNTETRCTKNEKHKNALNKEKNLYKISLHD